MAEEDSMWRDPLDDLIEELEQIPSAQPIRSPQQSYAQFIRYTDLILYGSADAKRRLKRQPEYQRFLADLRRTPTASAGDTPVHAGRVARCQPPSDSRGATAEDDDLDDPDGEAHAWPVQ
jgi:hypothetical protein